MDKSIILNLPEIDVTIQANLRPDYNPEAVAGLWKALPFQSMLTHTLVSGCNIYSFLPELKIDSPKGSSVTDRLTAEPGSIFMANPRSMFIKYGVDSEDRAFPLVGEVVPNDLDKLQALGERVWKSTYENLDPLFMTVRRGDSDPSEVQASVRENMFRNLSDGTSIKSLRVRALISDLNRQIKQMWFTVPQELIKIVDGTNSRTRHSGSYGQYFSTIVYCEGEVRYLAGIPGFGIFDSMLKMARSPDVNLRALKVIYETMVPGAANFLEFCGLEELKQFTDRAYECFDDLSSMDEFFELFSTLALYGNRLYVWVVHHYPWRQGDAYNYISQR